MKTKLKICGVRTKEIAQFCDNNGVDFIGLNFVPSSPRYIDPKRAREIRATIKSAKVVGVFADTTMQNIINISQIVDLDMVQLHGEEDLDMCKLIQLPVIKSISVGSELDLSLIEAYKKNVQYFLFDTKHENLKGGTGESFNWDILKNYQEDLPFFLAGGLDALNLEDAMSFLHPFAVDVASGSEEGGEKSEAKISALLSIIRAQ